MAGSSLALLPLFLWLAPLSPAAPATPAPLPGGGDAGVRDRLMRWSAPPTAPVAPEPASALAPLPPLSSRFGSRVDPIHGAVAFHAGIDIPGTTGSLVRAAAAGRVVRAGWAGGYGRLVEIAHPGGLVTRYGHLSELLVRDGDTVPQGQPIGRMGASGRATGSHLHFEVRRNGRAVDPLGYMDGQAAPEAMPATGVAPAPHRSAFAQRRAAADAERLGKPGRRALGAVNLE